MKSDKPNRPDEEAIIERFGQQARGIEVPSRLRQANAARIRGALEKATARGQQGAPWWRRRISVPLPLAAAILLVVFLQLAFQLTGSPGDDLSSAGRKGDIPTGPSATIERPPYTERCVYVARIGVVESNRTYFH